MAAPAFAAAVLGVISSGQTIDEVQKITASNGALGDWFGFSVSVSGDRAIVGAPRAYSPEGWRGAAYVFELGPSGWVEQAPLVASDGEESDTFGTAVLISGDRAIVGAPNNDGASIWSGAAYVFERGPSGWVEQAKLIASDGVSGNQFGAAVAMHGNYAIIGAPLVNDLGPHSGAAYVFEHGPGGWVEQAKLHASNGVMNDKFGASVSISGSRTVIGAGGVGSSIGSAYVFERGSSAWVEEAELTASEGVTWDRFGSSVSISGDRVVVGAEEGGTPGLAPGAAYVFERGASGWTEQARLSASDGAAWDRFGRSVSISGDRVLVGARYDDDFGAESGTAYAFERGPSGWVQQAKLIASDGAAGDYFGDFVSISGDHAFVGALRENAGSGSTYVFELDLAPAGCALRNGVLGLNPPDFTCTSDPKLGTTWTSQIATTPLVGQTTSLTFVSVGLGGPVNGVQVFGYELLALPPFDPLLVSGTGSHALLVPSAPALAGAQFTAQGLRLETTGGTNVFVLTNALDLVLGL